MQRQKKATFILKIDSNLVDVKYDFNLVSNINQDSGNLSMKTSIMDLSTEPDTESPIYTYLDESKQSHNCCITMSELLSSENLPKNTNIKCFWCKHCFDTSPIGCPVSYLANKVTKSYHSEITKDEIAAFERAFEEQSVLWYDVVNGPSFSSYGWEPVYAMAYQSSPYDPSLEATYLQYCKSNTSQIHAYLKIKPLTF